MAEVSREHATANLGKVLDRLLGRSRKSTAVFLGAGASCTFGYPLTNGLLPAIVQGLKARTILDAGLDGPGPSAGDPRKELETFLHRLLQGDRTAADSMPSVTSVLSLIDYSIATGQAVLPAYSLDQLRRRRQLLERAIVEVIPDLEGFAPDEEALFDRFCRLLGQVGESARGKWLLGIVTTNYDMLADVLAMRIAKIPGTYGDWNFSALEDKVDFGFAWTRPDLQRQRICRRPALPLVSLYKLHGSSNWLRCPLCENVYINPDGPIAWHAFSDDEPWDNLCHCSETKLEMQIVSPSFVRQMHSPNLIALWKNSLELLRDSDHWLIIGYSFPDEDVAIRALFTRALGSRRNSPLVSVLQRSDSARKNYEAFFPRRTLAYCTGGLDGLLMEHARRQ